MYARVRDTKRNGAGARQLAPSTASSTRHRRLRHQPSRRSAYQVVGVVGCARSARQSGCEARTAHRARLDQLAGPRPRRPRTPQLTSELAVEARAVAQRPSCRGTEGSAMIWSRSRVEPGAQEEESVWERRRGEARRDAQNTVWARHVQSSTADLLTRKGADEPAAQEGGRQQ
eukprot:scaffold81610_cov82-Phaeocystis_antarctica.AAC.1